MNCKYKFEHKNCFISIVLSLAWIMRVSPTEPNKLSVENYGRIIGLAVANDWDVSKVISNFYGWFILFLVSFVFFLGILEYLQHRNPDIKKQDSWSRLDASILAASVVVLFRMFGFFWKMNSFSFGYSLILGFFILDIIYCFSGMERRIDAEKYSIIKMTSMAISFSASVLFTSQWSDGRKWLLYYYIIFFFFIAGYVLYGIFYERLKLLSENIIWESCILLMGLPLLTSVYIELLNILNQYNIFISKPRRIYGMVLFVTVCLATVFGLARRGSFSAVRWKQIGYPLLLSGLGCLANQIPLQQVITPGLFESANASVLISDFLYFGKLPIVEHYGGHMLKNVVGGIVYAIVNHDSAGAILYPYSKLISVITVLLFYFFLKALLGNGDTAFLYVLCLPFRGSVEYCAVGILVCLSVGNYVKKHGYGRALLIWLSCVIAVLYRLDLGTAFGVAAVMALAVYLLKARQMRYLKETAFTFLAVIMSGLLIWTVLCLIKNISPFARLEEFIRISMSNYNWATGILGDKYSFYFAAAYMILPLMCIIAILYFLFCIKENQGNSFSYYMVIILGFAYFVNFPRGLVRHTLNELAVSTIVFSGSLFLTAVLYYICKKEAVFVYSAVFMTLLSGLMANQDNVTGVSLLEQASVKMNSFIGGWSSDWKDINEKKERVLLPEETVETVEAYQGLFDLLLEDNDTYIDFMNVSFLYSALGRECPVYVAQSPGHLSGEYTQEAFIQEIEEKKERIPLAILPAADADEKSLDSIANISRYYKVAEYIYQNYRPLCQFGHTAVWCRPEKYRQFASELTSAYELIDYGYDDGGILYLHNYPMYDIPYLWGNYDVKSGWDNPCMAVFSAGNADRYYLADALQNDKSKGNYLLLTCFCDNEYMAENNAEIILGSSATGEDELYRIRFNLHSGRHRYLFRISADYYWYTKNIDMMCIRTDEEIQDVQAAILAGD